MIEFLNEMNKGLYLTRTNVCLRQHLTAYEFSVKGYTCFIHGFVTEDK